MNHNRPRLDVGTIFQDSFALLRRNRWRIIVALVVMVGGGTLVDLTAADVNFGNFFFSVAALIFQFWLTARLLDDLAQRADGAGGFGALFVVGLISQLGILLGLLLLVIPGLILAVRWFIAVPVALSGGMGAIDALKQSWRLTEGHFWPILALLALIYLPMMVAAFGGGLLSEQQSPFLGTIVLNAGVALALMIGWHAAIALFLALQTDERSLEEVFA